MNNGNYYTFEYKNLILKLFFLKYLLSINLILMDAGFYGRLILIHCDPILLIRLLSK